MYTTTKILYLCWGYCGIYNKVQEVMGSPINEISWPWTGSTWEFPVLGKRAGRKHIFHCSASGWPALWPSSPHCWFVCLMAISLQHQVWKNIASFQLIRQSIKVRFTCCRSSSFWRLSPWFLSLWPMTSICLYCSQRMLILCTHKRSSKAWLPSPTCHTGVQSLEIILWYPNLTAICWILCQIYLPKLLSGHR